MQPQSALHVEVANAAVVLRFLLLRGGSWFPGFGFRVRGICRRLPCMLLVPVRVAGTRMGCWCPATGGSEATAERSGCAGVAQLLAAARAANIVHHVNHLFEAPLT